MKVIITKECAEEDKNKLILVHGGYPVYVGKRSGYLVETMNLFLKDNSPVYDELRPIDSLEIVSSELNLVEHDLAPEDKVTIYDVIINGQSLFEVNYVDYIRFVEIINRNYPYKSIRAEVKPTKFWSLSTDIIRDMTHQAHPAPDDSDDFEKSKEMFESSMRMFDRLSHVQAIGLWTVTHGGAFYTTPYEYDKDNNTLIISAEDGVSISFDDIEDGYEIKELTHYEE